MIRVILAFIALASSSLAQAQFRRPITEDENRQLQTAFERVGYETGANETRLFIVCMGLNLTVGLPGSGGGYCRDSRGQIYGFELVLLGVGMNVGGNIMAGYLDKGHRSPHVMGDLPQEYHFSIVSVGGSYTAGGRILCGQGSRGSEACLAGVEVGLGASFSPKGSLFLSELK